MDPYRIPSEAISPHKTALSLVTLLSHANAFCVLLVDGALLSLDPVMYFCLTFRTELTRPDILTTHLAA